MRNCLTIIVCVVLLFISSQAEASSNFQGPWTRTLFSFKVTIEKWGENCGPKPKSYGNSKKKSVKIISQGRQLVFSSGGIRTDRCISPNPRLSTISKSIRSGNWKRTCQTEQSDSKYERTEYHLKADGNNRLDYTSKTKVNWSLKGNQCIAILREHRVYQREGAAKVPETSLAADPEPKKTEEDNPLPECENPGSLKRLSVHPAEATIGPGERICFRVTGVDDQRCHFAVSAAWSAYQDEQQISGLLSNTGCFEAGLTAADSEGLYNILVKSSGKQASAVVMVAFPDLNDLYKAKLPPLGELSKSTDLQGSKNTSDEVAFSPGEQATSTPSTQALGAAQPSNKSKDTIVMLIVVVGVFLALGLLAAALIIRRKLTANAGDENWHEHDDVVSEAKNNKTEALATKFATESNEAAPLKQEELGMVCPKCHRGYDQEAQFCPHDSTRLVPYKDWRQTNIR